MTSVPVPRLVLADVAALERRARELAAPAERASDGAEAGMLRVVSFRLRGAACALEAAAIERAIVLGRPVAVPLGDGSDRQVAFVLERPLRVVDLSGAATGTSRSAAQLEGAPALVVRTAVGHVAVAVEGPLDLADDRLASHAGGGGPEAIHVAGRLQGGALLLDAGWLASWAGRLEA